MRDFFIRSFEAIIGIGIVLSVLAVIVSGGAAMFDRYHGGLVTALGIWIAGGISVLIGGGAAYLSLGIYHNTRRTAEALEKLLAKS
ncbi:hypothetical protein SAMN05877831_10359 [Rhodobacter maris]|uniref:Uncharacterized protein n=2 Tax=Rhodobacter maris TaxID=446682 RepID=A0A285S5X3_9RHOB|nr:hypothetical protein SAMN05877831_10359 [Rhodobacter maris]